jgi:hypothetical protein
MAVSLLLPLFGEDNGTIFTDYSPTPKTITRYGDAKTVTAQSKYYGSSAYFDGSGDALSVASSVGDGDFTIDFWARAVTIASTFVLFDCRATDLDANGLAFYFRHTGKLTVGGGSPFVTTEGATTLLDNVWYHCRLTRSGDTLYGYLNGTLELTRAWVASLTHPIVIGSMFNQPSGLSTGYLQDILLQTGVALVGDFTTPGRLLNSVSGTITDSLGQPCQRKVYAVSRPTDATAPQILAHGLSDPTTGAYELIVTSEDEVTRIVVSEDDEDPLLNDIVDRVIPA